MIGRGIGIPFRHGTGGGGTSIPPEIKKSIVAWYDPKKQGMTNFDVIEAYTEDFTTWTKNGNVTSAVTVNNNSIVINGSIKGASIFKKSNTSMQSINIIASGVKNGDNVEYRCVKNGVLQYIPIVNGINKLPASELTENPDFNIGFVLNINSTGVINLKQLPTSILKDFSGNKHDAYLYGFKGKLNSGVGIYNNDFTDSGRVNITWVYDTKDVTVNGADSFTVHNNYENWVFRCTTNVKPMTVKIVGVSNDINFKYRYESANGDKYIYFKKDGIYELPATIGTWQGFNLEKNNDVDVNITVTQIPDYPNQLCYDGKSYAVAYGHPILTDYTVIADRIWFAEKVDNGVFMSKALGQNGAFILEYKQVDRWNTDSYYLATNINIDKDNSIVYQTKNKYNEQTIYPGDKQDTDTLFIGTLRKDDPRSFIGCHGTIIVADRSFTEEEINWLKNNLFTIDIPTPAYDFDFSKYKDGSNLGDSITDKYGNVLELHNFTWKGMSGLGGYPIDLKATFPRNYTDGRDYICNDKEITCSYIGSSGLFQVLITNQDITKYIEIPEFTIKISGSENIKLSYFYIKEDFTQGIFNIIGNGIYKIPKSYKADKIVENLKWLGFLLQNNMNENVDFKLEVLPVYPGALVFDGVDDYAKLAKMTIKTVIIDFVNLELDKQVYDNRDKPNNYFSIYPQADTVAYEAKNSNGKTYINGELNTTIKTNDLLGVRCITCTSNDLAKETEQYICRDSYLNNYYGKIALYRITGFTEMLTADQVWKWYQKNKAKGGDK